MVGFVMAWFGGPVSAVAFAPTVLLCAAMHSLKNPLKQSRRMYLNYPTHEGGKGKVVASINDGVIAFQASILVADGVVLNVLHYKNGLGANEENGGGAFTYLETEVSLKPMPDSEVVIHYKNTKGLEERSG